MAALHFTFGNMVFHQAVSATTLIVPIAFIVTVLIITIREHFFDMINAIYNIFATRYSVIYTVELENGETGTTETILNQREINNLPQDVTIVSIERV